MSILATVLFLITAFFVFARKGHHPWLRHVLFLGVLIAGILTALEVGLGMITGAGVDDSVFYHMKTGLAGGDVSQYYGQIAIALVALVCISAALVLGLRRLPAGSPWPVPHWDAAVCGFVATAVLMHPVTLATGSYVMRYSLVQQQAEGYFEPRARQVPDKPKNLVMIYMEGLEQTFLDQNLFPGLAPEIRALAEQGQSFTNVGQTIGAGFTIGGMVASQCGVPLMLTGSENSMQVNRFLAGATCLGDVLSENGYNLSFIGGASLEFAGKGAFYETHGFSSVLGLDDLRSELTDPTYVAEWGLQDDTLLDLARKELNNLADAGDPFVMTMLTLDTHHPHGHADTNRSCRNIRFKNGNNPILNSVQCTDKLVADFVRTIREGPLGKDTVIVLMSDHLALGNSATQLLEKGARRNLFVVLDPDAREPARISRTSTTMDIGPTLMSMMGLDVDRMGFGVNLLGPIPTLPEQLVSGNRNDKKIDQFLLGHQSVFASLWDFPDISNGLYVNVEKGEVQLGKSAFRTPVLLTFDEALAVDQATLVRRADEKQLSNYALEIESGQSFLWIDQCPLLSALASDLSTKQVRELCVVHGVRDVFADVWPVHRSGFVGPKRLKTWLEDQGQDTPRGTHDFATRVQKAARLQGAMPLRLHAPDLDVASQGVVIRSSVHGAGVSYVGTVGRDQDQIARTNLRRGLTLIGIDKKGGVHPIENLDNCAPKKAERQREPWRDVIAKNSNGYATYLLVSQDTAFCDRLGPDYAIALNGLPLVELKSSKMRQPYVAVVDPKGRVWEFTNGDFDRVMVQLDPRKGEPFPFGYFDPNSEGPAQSQPMEETASKPAALPLLSTCVAPEDESEAMPVYSLATGTRFVGSDMESFVSFPTGWWGSERAGRWAGGTNPEITVILPEEESGQLLLGLEMNVPRGVSQTVEFRWEGELLYSMKLEEFSKVELDVTALPRGRPVKIGLVVNPEVISCPLEQNFSSDPRQMALFLQSISLRNGTSAETEAADNASKAPEPKIDSNVEEFGNVLKIFDVRFASDDIPAGERPNENGSEADKVLRCLRPDPPEKVNVPEGPMPVDARYPLGSTASRHLVSFSSGWWDAEDGGRWLGEKQASIYLTLPRKPEDMRVVIETAIYNGVSAWVEVFHDDEMVARQLTGEGRPLVIEAVGLPRSEPIELKLVFGAKEQPCPSVLGHSEDSRTMNMMLRSARVEAIEFESLGAAIAHGGGRFRGISISNSFDALRANSDRFPTFEVDLNWTSDGELVCIHDWDAAFEYRFGRTLSVPVTLTEFRTGLAMTADRPRNCDLEGLAGWVRSNGGIRVVTDVKSNPVEAHKLIADRHPDLIRQIIPQAYTPEQITSYREIGFQNVVWTLYKFGQSEERVLQAISRTRPSGIVMPISFAMDGLLQAIDQAFGLPVYVHTVNNAELGSCLMALGAEGLYSDTLGLPEIAKLPTPPPDCLPVSQ